MLLIVIAADLNRLPPLIRDVYRFPGGDKVGHFVLMGLLSLFVNAAALTTFPRQGAKRTVLITSLSLAFLVGLEELSQGFIQSRTLSLTDLLSSYAGIALCACLAYFWKS
ncbi:MAG: hypothetical protein D6770_00035 [Anaerolineae bacterium]|nr:MAG: hypothetical protein D6770_00035 [Anaerolineae bacterium]